MFKQSLAARVLAVTFLLIALPLLIYSFIFFRNFYEDLIENAYKTLQEASLYRTLAIQETAPVTIAFLNELNYLLDLEKEIPKLNDEKWKQKLVQLTGDIKLIDVYVLGKGENGRYKVLASDTGKEVGNYFLSKTRLPIAEEKGSVNFVRFLYSPEDNTTTPYLYSALAIHDSSHQVIGFLITRRNIAENVRAILAPTQEGNQKINFAIVVHTGFVQMASDRSFDGQRFTEISLERQAELLEESNRAGMNFFADEPLPISKPSINSPFFEFKWRGKMQLANLAAYSDIGVSVLAYSTKREIFGLALNRFIIIYFIYALILIFGAFITYSLTKWISLPLVQLVELMKKVREGNLNVRFKPRKFGFEINVLGKVFNETLTSLLDNMKHAEEERVRKETFYKELEIGRQVQQGLLPQKMPDAPGVQLYATYFSPIEVGGDFYDIFRIEDSLYLVCADAAGIGISPCLYSLNVRSLLRSYAHIQPTKVGQIMALSNNAFCEDTGESGMFVTAIMGIFQLKTKIFSYYSCGHVLGMIRKRSGEVITLKKRGMALGLMPAIDYEGMSIQLESEDILLLYTDGLVEAVNEKHQQFSEKRVEDLLRKRSWKNAKEIVEGLKREVVLFTGNAEQIEEVTILVMKVE